MWARLCRSSSPQNACRRSAHFDGQLDWDVSTLPLECLACRLTRPCLAKGVLSLSRISLPPPSLATGLGSHSMARALHWTHDQSTRQLRDSPVMGQLRGSLLTLRHQEGRRRRSSAPSTPAMQGATPRGGLGPVSSSPLTEPLSHGSPRSRLVSRPPPLVRDSLHRGRPLGRPLASGGGRMCLECLQTALHTCDVTTSLSSPMSLPGQGCDASRAAQGVVDCLMGSRAPDCATTPRRETATDPPVSSSQRNVSTRSESQGQGPSHGQLGCATEA